MGSQLKSGPDFYTTFTGDTPLGALPPHMLACVTAAAPTEWCDRVMGSAQEGAGYCASDQYRQEAYCACVNNALPCPFVTAVACANGQYAYKPTGMVSGAEYTECSKNPPIICENIISVVGSRNRPASDTLLPKP